MISHNTLFVFFLGVATFTWLGCADGSDTGEKNTADTLAMKPQLSESQEELASIATAALEYRPLSEVIVCTGEVEVPPRGMASVTAPLGGYISRTSMVPGSVVRKGQRLATLTNPEYIVLQQNFLETRGELRYAQQDYERQQALDAQNATAGKKLQQSQSAFAVLTARLAGLKAQLELIGIDTEKLEAENLQEEVALRAPISGYVTAVNHHQGEFVEPKEAIFEIVNMSELHLHLNVFEQDIARVREGQRIRFRPTSLADHAYMGTVSLISPKRDQEGSAFDVHAHIDHEGSLKPGMYVEAEILLSADSVAALPQSALVYENNIAYVIISDAGGYSLHRADTGIRMDGWVHIVNASAFEGKKVVVSGASRLAAALRRE